MTYRKSGYYSSPAARTSASTSKSSAIYECVVCFNKTSGTLLKTAGNCAHQMCLSCSPQYFINALSDPRYTSYATIECPGYGCKDHFVINDEFLSKFFTNAAIENWWKAALTKSFIKNKVSCPMEGCKGLFDAKDDDISKCTFTECYECRRGFCMGCQKPWHVSPTEKSQVFQQKLKEMESIKKTLKYAETQGWSRCPKCAYIVEKRSGCSAMYCRCGTSFCYSCGGRLGNNGCLCVTSFQQRSDVRRQMFAYNSSAAY